jgi:lipoate-protein ligase A
LRIEEGGPLASVSGANEFILGRVRDALNPLVEGEIEMRGQTDLTIDGRKFSGNAQKRKRHALLFHGTLLLDFELGLIETYLRMPSKQPDYRDGRGHSDFVTNLNLPAAKVAEALRETWGALETSDEMPAAEVERLVREKYSLDAWNLRR